LDGLKTTRVVFITGTDTGVGKTVLTALLLHHLRNEGLRALALKPFCSGSRADARILRSLQDRELTLNEVNPVYFTEAVAPLIAARKRGRSILLADVLSHIRVVKKKLRQPLWADHKRVRNGLQPSAPCLLIEGSGGLLVPLGEGFTVLDLIRRFRCEVLVVSRNRLGTINHTLLTVRALRVSGIRNFLVVLMDPHSADPSTASNASIMRECIAPTPLFTLPFLGSQAANAKGLRACAENLSEKLGTILVSLQHGNRPTE